MGQESREIKVLIKAEDLFYKLRNGGLLSQTILIRLALAFALCVEAFIMVRLYRLVYKGLKYDFPLIWWIF